MKKTSVKLPGEYYFRNDNFPCAVVKVHGNSLSHKYNYTGIPHWHDFSELVILTAGSGRQNINGVSYPVSAGDVFAITGKTMHYFEEYRNLEIVNILFQDRILHGIREYLKRIPGYHLVFRIEPSLRTSKEFHNTLHLSSQSLGYVMSLIRKMDSEFTGSNPGYEAAVMTGLYDLILFLSRSQDSCRGSQSVTRLAGLFSALEASFQEDWPLERMAKFTSMSINTLLRAFQSAAKQTPLSYLNSLRLNAAGHLLLESDRPVTEIALSCGFHDSNYFAKCFRAHFHQTPTQYRRQL